MWVRKAIVAFLGTGNYQPVVYRVGGRAATETRLSFSALHELFQDHELVVLATKEAVAKNLGLVDEELGKKPRWIRIPSGKSEEEVWEILKRLVRELETYDELILDITHGFRAQPLLAFGALLLVKNLRGTRVNHIFYGAYEQKDASGVAPFFDLNPLLGFVDWVQALTTFKHYGHADQLAGLLREENAALWRSGAEVKPQNLQRLSTLLQQISTALMVNRPHEVAKASIDLKRIVPSVERELQSTRSLAPIASYLADGLNDYRRLTARMVENPFNAGSKNQLRVSSRTILYLLKIKAYAQALTLAREALVTKLCLEKGIDPGEPTSRKAAESLLGAWSHLLKSSGKLSGRQKRHARLWDQVSELRNDVNHAGFRKNPMRAEKVAAKTQELCEKVASWLER